MIINHPLLGPRDSAEDPDSPTAAQEFFDYGYLRDNPAGWHDELWFHEAGDRSWLVVTRNTLTHEISEVRLARDVARNRGRSK